MGGHSRDCIEPSANRTARPGGSPLLLRRLAAQAHVDESCYVLGRDPARFLPDIAILSPWTGSHRDPLETAALDTVSRAGAAILAAEAVAKTITRAKVVLNGDSVTCEAWKIEALPMYDLKRGPSEGNLYHDTGRGNGSV